MKGYKLVLCIICAAATIIAAVTAVVIFRNEIIDYCADLKAKFDSKVLRRNGEYADYADM